MGTNNVNTFNILCHQDAKLEFFRKTITAAESWSCKTNFD